MSNFSSLVALVLADSNYFIVWKSFLGFLFCVQHKLDTLKSTKVIKIMYYLFRTELGDFNLQGISTPLSECTSAG
jgi:hypothetical protein